MNTTCPLHPHLHKQLTSTDLTVTTAMIMVIIITICPLRQHQPNQVMCTDQIAIMTTTTTTTTTMVPHCSQPLTTHTCQQP